MSNKLSAERTALQESRKDAELRNAQLRTELVAEKENSAMKTRNKIPRTPTNGPSNDPLWKENFVPD